MFEQTDSLRSWRGGGVTNSDGPSDQATDPCPMLLAHSRWICHQSDGPSLLVKQTPDGGEHGLILRTFFLFYEHCVFHRLKSDTCGKAGALGTSRGPGAKHSMDTGGQSGWSACRRRVKTHGALTVCGERGPLH